MRRTRVAAVIAGGLLAAAGVVVVAGPTVAATCHHHVAFRGCPAQTSPALTRALQAGLPEPGAPQPSEVRTSAPQTSVPQTGPPNTSRPDTSRAPTSHAQTSHAQTTVPRETVPPKTVPRTSRAQTSAPKNSQAEGAVAYARQQLGKPYSFGAAGPDAFDAAGLVLAAYASVDITLPHNAAAQLAQSVPVERDTLEPGDLVFYGTGRAATVAVYIGNNQVIMAVDVGIPVKILGIDFSSNFAYGRVVNS